MLTRDGIRIIYIYVYAKTKTLIMVAGAFMEVTELTLMKMYKRGGIDEW